MMASRSPQLTPASRFARGPVNAGEAPGGITYEKAGSGPEMQLGPAGDAEQGVRKVGIQGP